MNAEPFKPLCVSSSRARALLGIGVTKFWSLVRDGRIELIDVGGRRLVLYSSLERLAQPSATKTAA